ncbi:zinc iron permease, fungal plant [Trichoderma arundinaceum]|uniref:Zinc iron permease, fungal plant n=1 Tax=Trichoderma arundinaceum TaxID=490622 RepID=A0A395NW45_TRIAR|nr:zinc iron permease, fungal plant [Trichoderma arundinaceum]
MASSVGFDPTSVNLTDPNLDQAKVICALQLGGNEYNGNLGARISSIFVIFIVSTSVTLFPVLASRKPSWRIPAGLYIAARYIGTGVIITTAFIHLLDPAYQAIGGISCVGMTGPWADYSWCPALILLGAVITFLTELGAKCYIEAKHGVQTEKDIQMMVTNQPNARPYNCSDGLEAPSNGTNSDSCDKKAANTMETPSTRVLQSIAFRQQIGAFLILEFGIIFHSVIIGLNLGVVGSEFSTLYPVLVFHQSFEGLGIGARMASIPFPTKAGWLPWVLCLAYGLTTPLSIAIGLGLRTTYVPNSFTANVVSGVLDSLSTGILIYTGLVDLLARDFLFECDRTKDAKQLALMVFYTLSGAAVMALLGKWA